MRATRLSRSPPRGAAPSPVADIPTAHQWAWYACKLIANGPVVLYPHGLERHGVELDTVGKAIGRQLPISANSVLTNPHKSGAGPGDAWTPAPAGSISPLPGPAPSNPWF